MNMVREIESGLDLQRRETSALSVIEQVRDLAETIRSHRRILFIILYGSFARGDFHEGSDVDLIVVGDFRERPHKAGRQPPSVLPTSRSNRSATPKKSSPNRSKTKTCSSSGPWPRASGCRKTPRPQSGAGEKPLSTESVCGSSNAPPPGSLNRNERRRRLTREMTPPCYLRETVVRRPSSISGNPGDERRGYRRRGSSGRRTGQLSASAVFLTWQSGSLARRRGETGTSFHQRETPGNSAGRRRT